MKGYKTSRDYSLLWELIQQGYKILAIVHGFEPCAVEYKFGYRIYSFGCGYNSYPNKEENKDNFLNDCESLALQFIPPTNTETEQQ